MSTAVNQISEGEHILDQITQHVFLVLLRISWPKMAYQIADAIVEVNGTGDEKTTIAEEFRTNPQWKLMPEEWRRRLVNLEGRARALVSGASVQFAARGIAVLPVTRAAEIFGGLRTLRAEMERYRDTFAAEYVSILDSLKEKLGEDLYARAARKLPSRDEVTAKFAIIWAIIPAGGRSNANAEQLDVIAAALQEAINDTEATLAHDETSRTVALFAAGLQERLRNALTVLEEIRNTTQVAEISDAEAAALIQEARAQMDRFTHEMLEDLAQEPRQILVEAANNLIEALNDSNRTIRNGTIEQVQRAFQMVEGFSFLAGDELLHRIAQVRERLNNVTPQVLNSNSEVGALLAAGLRGVRDAAADASTASEAMRNFRGIRLRDRTEPQPATA